MTEKRLTEILIDHRVCERMANGRTFAVPSALEAMKQAVNEALDEAADKANVTDNGEDFADCMGIENEYGNFSVCVHKQSILNLKVK